MGHSINYATYPENVDKQRVQAYWDEVAMHEDCQEGCTGLPDSIIWYNKPVLSNYEAAQNWIEEHDSNWYDQIAIRYKDVIDVKPSKALEKALERKVKATNNYYDLSNKFHFENVKSQFIGCKKCGSKLSIKFLHNNFCPLCKNDLRPETILKRIEVAKENMKKAEKELKNMQKEFDKKQEKKAKIMWLVKTEYHV